METSAPTLRNWLLCAGLLTIAAVAYWPSVSALWDYWTDDNHRGAHGLLVVLLFAWLLFRARHELAGVPVRPSRLACGLLVLCSAAWLVFWRAGIQELHILLLPVLMGLAVLAALGLPAALKVAFPLGYLYFAMPAWGIFIGPLQALTIRAVSLLAPLIGVPARIHGDLVLLPGVGTFQIASGCSGVNFLTVGLAVAALLGEVERATLWRRAMLLAVMGVLSILSNWIRVLVVVDAGYTTNMRHVLVSRGHYTFGWVLFTVVMVAFVWWAARFQEPATPPRTYSYSDSTAVGLGTRAYVGTVVALVAMPVIVYTVVARLDLGATPVAFDAPAGRAGWHGPVTAGGGAWNPDFVGPHSLSYAAYQGPGGDAVEVVAIGYAQQAQGQELVNEENSLLGPSPLAPVAESTVTLNGRSYIELVAADSFGHRMVVWSVYDIGGREFVAPLMSQLWYGLRSLSGAPYSVMFAFRAACTSSCDSARATLSSFARTMGAEFFGCVSRAPRPSSTSRPL
jgi:EpsI family protein